MDKIGFSLHSKVMVTGKIEHKADTWDSRVALDPLFWMAEKVTDTSELWTSGRRDFADLMQDIEPERLSRSNVLEIGCGIGRLLRAAKEKVQSVCGLETSALALEQAKVLLRDLDAVEFALTNSNGLIEIDTKFDIVFSYATLPHLTPATVANYLRSIRSVLVTDGIARLQLYLGAEVIFARDDTYSIRCYDRQRFTNACYAAGLEVVCVRPAKLPYDGKDHELNREPVIVELRAAELQNQNAEAILNLLVSTTEPATSETGSWDEHRVLLTKVNGLIRAGKLEEAERFLNFAVSSYKNASAETIKSLSIIRLSLGNNT